MSNFDVFNETGVDVDGAELDLIGVHSSDVTKTYPSHFNSLTMSDYTNGTTFGTRMVFTEYNFTPAGYITPTLGQTTNGHDCVNLPGCEHFGFAVRAWKPTRTAYYWLDGAAAQYQHRPQQDRPMSTYTT